MSSMRRTTKTWGKRWVASCCKLERSIFDEYRKEELRVMGLLVRKQI